MIYGMTICCSVFVTVLPVRLLIKMSEEIESVLRLKRDFMRYVSHKIRSSPLNVAHAGLELLKTDLEAARASVSILNLLDDIFSASSTATTRHAALRAHRLRYIQAGDGCDSTAECIRRSFGSIQVHGLA